MINNKGIIISTSSVSHLTTKEKDEDQIVKMIKDLDDSIEAKIGNYHKAIANADQLDNNHPYYDFVRGEDILMEETIEFQERLQEMKLNSSYLMG